MSDGSQPDGDSVPPPEEDAVQRVRASRPDDGTDILASRGTPEPPPPPERPLGESDHRLGLSVLALLAFLGAAYVAHPVWMGIVVGTAMGFTSEPLYRWLAPRLRYKRPLAALITTLTGGLASVVVIALVAYIAVTEVVDMVSEMRFPSANDVLGEQGLRALERLRVSPDQAIKQANEALVKASEAVAGGLAQALSATTSLMLTAVIAFFTMYYVLLEWSALVRRLEHLLPLHPRHTRALVNEFRVVGRSALIGTMGTALVQGTLGGIGYAIAGVSQPMLWGTITMLASFIPVVGTAAVWIPIAIVLAVAGHTGWAVFVALWGFFIVMAVSDYVVRPRLVGSKGQVHPLPLLVSLLGGVEMFGLMGVIIGPILMSLCLSVLKIYEHQVDGDPTT